MRAPLLNPEETQETRELSPEFLKLPLASFDHVRSLPALSRPLKSVLCNTEVVLLGFLACQGREDHIMRGINARNTRVQLYTFAVNEDCQSEKTCSSETRSNI